MTLTFMLLYFCSGHHCLFYLHFGLFDSVDGDVELDEVLLTYCHNQVPERGLFDSRIPRDANPYAPASDQLVKMTR